MGALDGVKVVDLSRLLPGPYCSMVLADHGAEVIAIEGRQFAADDLYFTDLFRNKKHMTLNLKSVEGKKIFFQLIETADIVLEGFRPGVAEKLGVDYETVQQVNSKIIYCSISGYGQTGPEKESAGHDVNYLSRSGVLNLIGQASSPPSIPGIQIADIAGGLNGVIGILLALHERNSSGIGQYIDISMTDALLGFLTVPYNFEKKFGYRQQRSSTIFSHRYACYNTYETSDNRYFAIGAVEKRFWLNLCEILDRQDLIPLQYDDNKREEIISNLRSLFIKQPISFWEEKLSRADVCFSIVQTMDEVLTDPLFTERDMVVNPDATDGNNKSFGISVKLNRTPGSLRSGPQQFGGATAEILTELGYSLETIQSFLDTGVI